RHRFACSALGMWVALAGTGLGLAQPPIRKERREERREDRQEARKVKQILGSQVSISGGQAVGAVDDVILSDDGYVEYLVVGNEGKYVLVPWEAAKFDMGKRTATVTITQERFKD